MRAEGLTSRSYCPCRHFAINALGTETLPGTLGIATSTSVPSAPWNWPLLVQRSSNCPPIGSFLQEGQLPEALDIQPSVVPSSALTSREPGTWRAQEPEACGLRPSVGGGTSGEGHRVNGKSVPVHVGNTTTVMISLPEALGPALLTPFSAIDLQGLLRAEGQEN